MKRRTKITLASILAAVIIAAVPVANIVPVTLTAEASTTSTMVDGMKEVTAKGDLTVSIPDKVSDSYEVKAYEILQLVIPEGTTWTEGTAMTNGENSQNVYVVTDNFKAFFATAKNQYNNTVNKLDTKDTLYLTYDAANNQLDITANVPESTKVENKDYIVINNGNGSKLDKTYFEADLVSRIADSNPIAGETNASAARLLSDWASRYIKANSVDADQTAKKVKSEETEKYTFAFSKANVDVEGDTDTSLVYGYYVIVTNDDEQDNDKSVINQSILNVPQAENVTLKATPITVDKSVSNLVDANRNNNGETNKNNDSTTRYDEDETSDKYDRITANIGDVLQYRIESHIPSLTSYVLSDANKLLALGEELTEDNFSEQIDKKFIYTFRDTMTNQDFIPVDTKISNVNVSGLKMEITIPDADKVTYVVKVFENDKGESEYYLVPEKTKDTATVSDDAIGRLWDTGYGKTTVGGKDVYQNFFAINFDLKKLKSEGLDGKDVVFIYNAELKGETSNNDASNTAKFTYSNDPFDNQSTDTIEDDDKVYTYDLKVDKLFSDGATTDFYEYVKFKLYSDEAKTHVINFVEKKNDDGESIGSYVRADSDDANSVKTDTLAINTADGTLLLHGLGEGKYYLEEQPNDDLKNAGYNIVNTITIVVTAKDSAGDITNSNNFALFKEVTDEDENVKKTTGTTAKLDGVNLSLSPTSGEYGVEFDVINQKGFRLPLTGEYGNWALAIAGILIVAVSGTVIVLVNRKKKDLTADNEA